MHESFLRFFDGRFPFTNAAASDAVGTHCHLVKRGLVGRLCENTMRFFVDTVFS